MRIGVSAAVLSACAFVGLFPGCGRPGASTKPIVAPPPQPPAASVTFRDVAAASGVNYHLGHGDKTPLTILDTAPGGCAQVDLNRDGWLDLVLVGPPKCAVYRNRRDGTFEDVTVEFGLDRPGPWMGCTVGDYNGDGYPDLFLTGYRRTALYRNDGGRRLVDVTREAGVGSELWTTSAAFADVDGDGRLDLYVGGYVDYRVGARDLCLQGEVQTACGPEYYGPERGVLFRNLDGRRFKDVTRESGLDAAAGKTWAVGFADYDDDGRPDLYLANDQTPCNLFHNLGAGRFAEVGIDSGTAYDALGRVQGGMSVDWADYDNDGRLDLFVSTYVYQDKEIYRNEGGGTFRPVGRSAGVAQPAYPHVAFGGGFLDADNNGLLDLLIANGHIRDNVAQFEDAQSYRQPLQLFENAPDHRYREVSHAAGPPFETPLVGRGVAFGDYDNDGLVDALVMDLAGSARLLRNQGGPRAGNWLHVRLAGNGANTEGIGARVTLEAGGKRQIREITRGRSVLSAGDAAAHFGVGAAAEVDLLRVRWPDGRSEEWRRVTVNQRRLLRYGTGSALARRDKHLP